MRRTICAVALAAGIWGGGVRADDVDALGGKVMELNARVGDLDAKLKPPTEPGPEVAERRLIDAQVLYELKNYEAASIILYDVVEKYPQSPSYPEALYYLSDSLFLKRDYLSSRRFFEKIVEVGPQTRRYPEALQKLIELSLHTGDYSPVDGYIAKLESLASQKPLPAVPYVKGKYFFFRQQYDKALAALDGLKPDHPFYFHSLYFVGASYVALGGEKLEDAKRAFAIILNAPPKDDAQKRIQELAHLGVARIAYEQGQLTNALEAYGKIGTKSDFFNDALYEAAWASIKGKDFVKARRSLDLLLTNAPDSPLAPEVKLNIGQLHIRQNEFGPATDYFTKTRDEYAPIHRQLEEELQRTGDAPAYFRDLIAKNLSKFDASQVLTPAAQKWVRPEPEVQRVARLIGDEADLKKSLDEADEIVRRLEKALSGPARVNVFPELAVARAKAVEIASELTSIKQQLANKEQQLIAPVAGSEKALLQELDRQRQELEKQLAALPTKADSIADRQQKAREAFNGIDKQASEIQTQLNGVRNSLVAARKFYHDKVDNTLPIEPPPAPRAGGTRTEGPSMTFSAKKAEMDGRVAGLKQQFDSVKGRVERLKEAVINLQQGSKPEVEGCTNDVEALQVALDGVRKDAEDASASVGVDDADMQAAQQVKNQYDDVLRRQHGVGVEVRARLGGADRTKAEQIESILDRSRGVEQRIAQLNQRIESILDVKLKDIQSALVDEKAHVLAYRGRLNGYTNESAEVGGGVVADTFKKVAKRFYDVVVRSDVGIIDVAWALKESSTKETSRLVAERKRELKLLDDEFKALLREGGEK